MLGGIVGDIGVVIVDMLVSRAKLLMLSPYMDYDHTWNTNCILINACHSTAATYITTKVCPKPILI